VRILKCYKYFWIRVIKPFYFNPCNPCNVYVGSRSHSAKKMEVYYKERGGSFKFKWRLWFYIVLNISMINVLVKTEKVDSGGYIVYCPCMGKMLIHTNFIVCIFKGYVVNCILLYIH
jgi:hypothetical protein